MQWIGCAPYARRGAVVRYTAKLLYANDAFNGASFSGQSLLVLPGLTGKGPVAIRAFSPRQMGSSLQKLRKDLHLSYGEAFEQAYKKSHDERSLFNFYASLFNGDVIAIQTSDSVWKTIDAAYVLVVRLKYAAVIRGFDGNSHKRLSMEVELWDVKVSETVWRLEVQGFDDAGTNTDDHFIGNALCEAFLRMPGYVPSNNESDW
jgi:hypothetical protein